MKKALIILGILLLAFSVQAAVLAADTEELTGVMVTDAEEILTLLTSGDWTTEGYTLRFEEDGSISEPSDGELLFVSYEIADGILYITSEELPDQEATVYETEDGISLVFDTMTSEYDTLTLVSADQEGDADQSDETADETADETETETTDEETAQTEEPESTPVATVPVYDVVTPTPMPVSGEDETIVTLLTQGLWKPLGSDGTLYYQFLEDGTMLTIQVSQYTVSDGVLTSDVIDGEILLGGNSAFTIQLEDGTKKGYVLNRNSNSVQSEEFITPTPSPTPTVEPTATPSPTPSPTPTPTPEPTPTLSPYEVAVQTVPVLVPLDDAEFLKRRSLDVYSAPSESSYRNPNATVTTNSEVTIYGVVDDWVLVAYPIGYDDSKGRVGYIKNTTLKDADTVKELTFANLTMTVQEDASATDDPHYSQEELFLIDAGDTVTLLAFMGDDWAYVETTYESKQCRVFIQRSALVDEGSQ